jgi:hypothetical protein
LAFDLQPNGFRASANSPWNSYRVVRISKTLAARKETSISKLLAESLGHAVQKEESYEAAKRNALNTLKKGFRLGGRMNWQREDLYER